MSSRGFVRLNTVDVGLVPGSISDVSRQLYQEWVNGRRRLEIRYVDGDIIQGQLLGFDGQALYIADHEGRPRLVYVQALKDVRPLEYEPDGVSAVDVDAPP